MKSLADDFLNYYDDSNYYCLQQVGSIF